MFPSQDDKTNAFMDSLARRISYMTNKIYSMSEDGSREGSSGRDSQTKENVCNGNDEASEDSGLSSKGASRVASEMNSPDDDNDKQSNHIESKNKELQCPKSPKSSSSLSSSAGSPLKVSSPSKEDDKLNMERDADLIEESRRGINILRALQERHRKSLILDDSAASEIGKSINGATDSKGIVTDVWNKVLCFLPPYPPEYIDRLNKLLFLFGNRCGVAIIMHEA